jgi:hypothetical protein
VPNRSGYTVSFDSSAWIDVSRLSGADFARVQHHLAQLAEPTRAAHATPSRMGDRLIAYVGDFDIWYLVDEPVNVLRVLSVRKRAGG